MLFTVISYHGIFIYKDDMTRYFYNYLSEVNGKRINEYLIEINDKIISTLDNDNRIQIIETELLRDAEWKICQPYDIHLYYDIELNEYAMTIPKNTDILIDKRIYYKSDYVYMTSCYFFSFFFYPNLTLLCPMKNILIARVINKDGLIVRQGIENYSPVIGIINYGTFVLVQEKDFTKIPMYENSKRLCLYEKKGWINFETTNIEWIGIYNHSFICNTDIIPIDTSIFIKTETIPEKDLCIICFHNKINTVFVHGNDGHDICCKICSEKINDKCPLCKQKIEKIIYLYD